MKKIIKLINDPFWACGVILRRFLSRHINDDKLFIKWEFFFAMKYFPNLKKPLTYNEKLQWLKINDIHDEYTSLVDKYEVKKYIKRLIGDEYIIPTLGVWDKFEDIDFNKLPNQFVLKTTHDSGGIIVCKDKSKLDLDYARNKINRSLRHNYYLEHREYPYKNVKPRIIAEQYMVDESGTELKDYKFFCFGGEPKLTLVCTDRFSKRGLKEDFYDLNWERMAMKRPNHDNADIKTPRPKYYNLMCDLSKKLSDNIPFLRCDFYEINNKVYFGELTFFPATGMEGFYPDEWDKTLGGWIDLSLVK